MGTAVEIKFLFVNPDSLVEPSPAVSTEVEEAEDVHVGINIEIVPEEVDGLATSSSDI